MHHNDDDWAVFWCSLLGPILLDEITAGERKRYLLELSQKEVLLPTGKRKRISYSTLRRKVRQFRERKIDGLRRRPRNDRGESRKNRQAMIARAVELKREQPYRSPRAINRILEKEFGRTIPKSTMNRHLHRHGVTRRKLGVVPAKIRCRWTRDHTNSLWVGDFSEGPRVLHEGRAIKTHLSVWIDCHSRYVVEGRYYYHENLDILIDSLLRAWGAHGASRQMYLDNAKIYRSDALKLACTQLNIELLHRPPRDPSPGGIIERVIQTTQVQYEAEVRAGKVLTLSELNRYYQAWLSADYHLTKHSQTGQTPRDRYTEESRFRRNVKMQDAREFFHVREERRVDLEFSDVRVKNQFYKADISLRGDKVIVSFDPFSSMDEVRLLSLHDQFLGVAKRYDREKGAHSQPKPPAPQTPLDRSYLELLEEQHREQQRLEAEAGVDYHRAQQRPLWSFPSLAAAFAKLLGRQGGASGLSTQEMEQLSQVHKRLPQITQRLLERAFQQAEVKTIPVIVFQLQILLDERTS